MTYGQRQRAAGRQLERALQQGKNELEKMLAAMTPSEREEYEQKCERVKAKLAAQRKNGET